MNVYLFAEQIALDFDQSEFLLEDLTQNYKARSAIIDMFNKLPERRTPEEHELARIWYDIALRYSRVVYPKTNF